LELRDISRFFSSVVEGVVESVVTIAVSRLSFDSLTMAPREVRGIGSGFVISGDGFVVTNSHVVGGAKRVYVYFADGVAGEGVVVASDPYRDLALLEVSRRGVKPIVLGDSDRVRVGEIVFAIGSPLGVLGSSVSMGVVSGVGRTIRGRGVVLEDLIQTDAAINPGNSGGPLVDAEGEAIGVTTAIIPFAQGIGFAIPINSVKRFLEMITRFGRPIVAWIGVQVVALSKSIARVYGLPVEEGVLVVGVVAGSPADSVGLRVGDIIVEAGGSRVRKPSDLKNAVEDSASSGVVELVVVRGSSRFRVRVPVVVRAL